MRDVLPHPAPPTHRRGFLPTLAALAALAPWGADASTGAGGRPDAPIVSAAPAVPMRPVPESGAPGLFTLACGNGLPVVIDARPGSRTVFAQIGVRVGSRDEPDGLAGMSHLLEHLLFKEDHGPGAASNPAFSALRSAGALVNASTDFEMTEYHADLPSDRFDEGWRALVNLVAHAAFDEKEVARERGVVLQEAALGKVDPVAIVAYSVLDKVFSGDPIAQPVIGFRRTLRSITAGDLERHYRRFYTPSNMFAVIVGDVDPEHAAALVEATLGAEPRGGEPHPPYPAPAARLRPLYRFRTLVKQSYLLAGSLTGGEASPDAMALDLLSAVLGEGRTSRLHRRLVRREAVADEVLAIAFQVSTAGALAAGVAVAPRDTARARDALIEEIEHLAREPVSRDELDTARTLMRGRMARQFETNDGIAEFRARRLLLRQSVGRDEFLARAEALTPDDLLAVARRHWGPGASLPQPVEIQVLPARGPGKLFAALKFLFFRRL